MPNSRSTTIRVPTDLDDAISQILTTEGHVNFSKILFQLAREGLTARDAPDIPADQLTHLSASFFDAAPIPRALVGLKGSFDRVNQAFCYWLGYTPEELLGMTFFQITVAEDQGKGQQAMKDMLEGKRLFVSFKKRYTHKAGHPVGARLISHPVRDTTGRIIRLASTVLPE